MGDPSQLIVRFKRGVAEEAARGLLLRHGAKIRRRMRGDDPADLWFLVRPEGSPVEALARALEKESSVAATEIDRSDYRAS